jgi:hydroxypyruvate reductase
MTRPGRVAALAVWEAALAAAAAAPLVRDALHLSGDRLRAGPLTLDLGAVRWIFVLGAGKAGATMAQAVEDILADRIGPGLVVVKDGYSRPTTRIPVVEAGHPIPDTRGLSAAARLLGLAREATADDLVLVLISGGGSALLPAPAAPVTLDEKRRVTGLLMAAGADIRELNAVRKHLSEIKGGRLAQAAAPARVLTLALSDVIGNPLDVIASGPTAPDPTTFADALAVIDRRRVEAPASVQARLAAGARGEVAETPKPEDPIFDRVTNLVIGDNSVVVEAAARRARELGYEPVVLSRELAGEAREAARALVARVRQLRPPACLIAGGETTVTVRGGGLGGRCQEFALAAALEIQGDPEVTVLAAGTDGTDGPTTAAGAIADGATTRRGAGRGLEARASLEANDAFAFFRGVGDLVTPGPTGTNLLDLYLLVRHEVAR